MQNFAFPTFSLFVYSCWNSTYLCWKPVCCFTYIIHGLLYTWMEDLGRFFQILCQLIEQNVVLLSFVGIQKICIFTKFRGCSSKIELATPILILKFKRAWQTQFFSHTLQILVNDRFFIGHQMIFYSIFCVSNGKAEIWEKLFFLFLSSPQAVKNPMIMDYNYRLGATLKKKKQFFSNFNFPVTNTKKDMNIIWWSTKDLWYTKIWSLWLKN